MNDKPKSNILMSENIRKQRFYCLQQIDYAAQIPHLHVVKLLLPPKDFERFFWTNSIIPMSLFIYSLFIMIYVTLTFLLPINKLNKITTDYSIANWSQQIL